ncbi:hypothetical protein EK904_013144 [Melospiza melodia maxima]|nr:hypothetical protein EK904_013144 [Melospiza melodia maxima]
MQSFKPLFKKPCYGNLQERFEKRKQPWFLEAMPPIFPQPVNLQVHHCSWQFIKYDEKEHITLKNFIVFSFLPSRSKKILLFNIHKKELLMQSVYKLWNSPAQDICWNSPEEAPIFSDFQFTLCRQSPVVKACGKLSVRVHRKHRQQNFKEMPAKKQLREANGTPSVPFLKSPIPGSSCIRVVKGCFHAVLPLMVSSGICSCNVMQAFITCSGCHLSIFLPTKTSSKI